ncbi:MAG: DUF6159 family protein [Pseudomonadota bacterium]
MKIIKNIIASLSRSYVFTVRSVAFLYQHKKLLLLPVFCYLSWIILYFILSVVVRHYANKVSIGAALAGGILIGYFLLCFVFIFFNAVVISCTLSQLQNKKTSITGGIVTALKRLGKLLGWGLLNTTFGLIMYLLDFFDDTISPKILDVPWSLYSNFAIPMIICENIGPIDALCHCRKLFGHKWHHVSSINLIYIIIILAPLYFLVYMLNYNSTLSVILANVALLLLLLFTLAIIVIYPTLLNIIRSALYLHLAKKETISNFDDALLNRALIANDQDQH